MELPDTPEFLSDLEDFLVEYRYAHTTFSKDVMGNPAFIAHLREGRGVTLETARKCYTFMDKIKHNVEEV